jgi:hypothetical protein
VEGSSEVRAAALCAVFFALVCNVSKPFFARSRRLLLRGAGARLRQAANEDSRRRVSGQQF